MSETALPHPEPVEGTIVFTDIVGFTEFTATRGDVEALQLLATQDRLLDATLSADARVVKELGDGLLLWFPEPVTALHTAFALHRGFGDESAASGLALGIRVGMHQGSALQRGDDLIGHDVQRRIEDRRRRCTRRGAGVRRGARRCRRRGGKGSLHRDRTCRDEGGASADPALARQHRVTQGKPRPRVFERTFAIRVPPDFVLRSADFGPCDVPLVHTASATTEGVPWEATPSSSSRASTTWRW
jgi:hypothetical protein